MVSKLPSHTSCAVKRKSPKLQSSNIWLFKKLYLISIFLLLILISNIQFLSILRNNARKSYDSLSPLPIVFVSEIPRYSNP